MCPSDFFAKNLHKGHNPSTIPTTPTPLSLSLPPLAGGSVCWWGGEQDGDSLGLQNCSYSNGSFCSDPQHAQTLNHARNTNQTSDRAVNLPLNIATEREREGEGNLWCVCHNKGQREGSVICDEHMKINSS